jgi:hypothetical protein
MNPIQKRELKRQAWMRLAAQRRRAGLLRGRVVALSLVCFVILWAVVFAQMATGNDPVLSGKEKAVAANSPQAGHPRKVERERAARKAQEGEQEPEVADGPEIEEEFFEAEVEPEEEFFEAEPEFVEVEPEPLVTSQS